MACPAGARAMRKTVLLAEMLPEEETVDHRISISKTNTIPKFTVAESRMQTLPWVYPTLNFHPSLIIKKQNKILKEGGPLDSGLSSVLELPFTNKITKNLYSWYRRYYQ